ncbi:MAG: class I SAM-dependent RNA methyltransferase [Pedobacter sp.]
MAEYIDDLLIESLAYGGSGIGHHDGKVVFVPLVAPGDRVRCVVSRQKKRFAEAQVEQLLVSSGVRIAPACPLFGKCGGCQWQHLSYSEQCVWKERIYKDFLVRKLGVAPEAVLPIVPSPEQWGYRSRVQFKCVDTSKGFQIGFYRRGSHNVIPVSSCPIMHPALNHAKDLLRQWISNTRWAKRVPQIDLAVDDQDRVRAVIHGLISDVDDFVAHLKPLAMGSGVAVFVQSDRKSTPSHVCGPLELIVEVDSPVLRLGYGPGGFAQINLPQNRAMVREVIGALISNPPSRVLDLFCGMGNFSLPVARLAQEVIGVEAYPQSIEMARLNARLNEVGNAAFFAREAYGAATLYGSDLPLDLVILDPPRSGAYDVARELVAVRPAKILYVSCDPPTLVRDLQVLLNNGYRLIWSRPFDLFPQTHHTESITLLERV